MSFVNALFNRIGNGRYDLPTLPPGYKWHLYERASAVHVALYGPCDCGQVDSTDPERVREVAALIFSQNFP